MAPKGRQQNDQHTQFASGVATEDAHNATVVLESRGLKKTLQRRESISVLADANLSLRRERW